jgi:hypothetical protein
LFRFCLFTFGFLTKGLCLCGCFVRCVLGILLGFLRRIQLFLLAAELFVRLLFIIFRGRDSISSVLYRLVGICLIGIGGLLCLISLVQLFLFICLNCFSVFNSILFIGNAACSRLDIALSLRLCILCPFYGSFRIGNSLVSSIFIILGL